MFVLCVVYLKNSLSFIDKRIFSQTALEIFCSVMVAKMLHIFYTPRNCDLVDAFMSDCSVL